MNDSTRRLMVSTDSPISKELPRVLENLANIKTSEPLHSYVIEHCTGENQDRHVDHISLSSLNEFKTGSFQFIRRSDNSWSERDPGKVVPTVSFLVLLLVLIMKVIVWEFWKLGVNN
eukprot:UN22781